jgi:hypothetical protein
MITAALAALVGRADAAERPTPSAPQVLPAGEYLSDPAWIRTPTPAELAALYPKGAKAREGGALAAECVISETGALEQCGIDHDFTPEQGLGPATLQALKLFQASATTRDGRPAGGLRIVLWMGWTSPRSEVAAEGPLQIVPLAIPSGSDATTVVWSPDWTRLPTVDELVGLYPEAERLSGLGGEAIIQCKVTQPGGLADCVLLRQIPSVGGFGAATLKAARYFMVRPTIDGKSLEGAIVLVRLKWQLGH